jgi:hypothetical protein
MAVNLVVRVPQAIDGRNGKGGHTGNKRSHWKTNPVKKRFSPDGPRAPLAAVAPGFPGPTLVQRASLLASEWEARTEKCLFSPTPYYRSSRESNRDTAFTPVTAADFAHAKNVILRGAKGLFDLFIARMTSFVPPGGRQTVCIPLEDVAEGPSG